MKSTFTINNLFVSNRLCYHPLTSWFQGSRGASAKWTSTSVPAARVCTEAAASRGRGGVCTAASRCSPNATTSGARRATSAAVLQGPRVIRPDVSYTPRSHSVCSRTPDQGNGCLTGAIAGCMMGKLEMGMLCYVQN